MQRIYQSAKAVLIWLGPNDAQNHAPLATNTIRKIGNFLLQKLNLSIKDLVAEEEVYHNILFSNRDRIPMPHECDFITEEIWQSLIWIFKFPYFTRLWAVQEINANTHREAHCGEEVLHWDLVEFVAGYILLGSTFSQSHDFSDTFCWWASTAPSELRQAENWLHMLYLASNFKSSDPRDVIYGLRGMIKCDDGGHLLDPDYNKSTLQVYRDSVEAALINYKSPNALLYVSELEDPSWVPRWNTSMLFRNPFRFGRPVPWHPSGRSRTAVWSIDKDKNVLSLSGFTVDDIEHVEFYKESYFGSAALSSENGKTEVRQCWQNVLGMVSNVFASIPLTRDIIKATAVSLSYGLDQKCQAAEDIELSHNFVAYLRNILDLETFEKYISQDVIDECKDGNGEAFGKPVWDFEYPTASFFITKGKMLGCSIASTSRNDILFVPYGCSYPLILRPDGETFRIRGFCFVYGVMHGEKSDTEETTVKIC